MPTATLTPQKRVLGDSTKVHRNANTLPPLSAAKKRKLNIGSSPATFTSNQPGANVKLGSSQPKSQFEEDVLEKLTQDISGLKQKNSEKDQQWERPGLGDFDEKNDNLCFQQIEAEEGTLHGGKTAVKLFGVTEASHFPLPKWSHN
jgi:DNA polymerase delta subunit 1